MEKQKLIDYLTASGYNDQQIAKAIQETNLRNEFEKMIAEYERQLAYNGFTRQNALENFQTYQKIKSLRTNKEKLLSK